MLAQIDIFASSQANAKPPLSLLKAKFTRNGKSRKTLKGEFGELPIEVPRDRHGSFEPKLVTKHQTRWAGFDDKIMSLYARGMTVREIQAHLEEMYGTEVSPSLISSVTDAVVDEVKAWQARPLNPIYPIVYLDCIHVKVREGTVRVKAVYLAIGITMDGEKEVLGLWLAQTEGAKFWLQVVTELRTWCARYLHRLRGRPEGLSRCHRGRLPGDHGSTVHRPYGSIQSELRFVETTPGSGGRPSTDLPVGHRRRGRTSTPRI